MKLCLFLQNKRINHLHGHVSDLSSCSGGIGIISSCVTDSAPCLIEVPIQSEPVSPPPITITFLFVATNKNVIVIGGGDTGSDCIGTSIRQGAESVTQLEIMPIPPEQEDKSLTWPCK